ncbi:hypothetical protein STENM327S_02285 [Streptomyces tendae]
MRPDRPLPQGQPHHRPGEQPYVAPVADEQQYGRRDQDEDLEVAAESGRPRPGRQRARGGDGQAQHGQTEHHGRRTGQRAPPVPHQPQRAVQHGQRRDRVGRVRAASVVRGEGQREQRDDGDHGQHGRRPPYARRRPQGQGVGHLGQLPVGRTSAAAVRSRMHTSRHSDQSSM